MGWRFGWALMAVLVGVLAAAPPARAADPLLHRATIPGWTGEVTRSKLLVSVKVPAGQEARLSLVVRPTDIFTTKVTASWYCEGSHVTGLVGSYWANIGGIGFPERLVVAPTMANQLTPIGPWLSDSACHLELVVSGPAVTVQTAFVDLWGPPVAGSTDPPPAPTPCATGNPPIPCATPSPSPSPVGGPVTLECRDGESYSWTSSYTAGVVTNGSPPVADGAQKVRVTCPAGTKGYLELVKTSTASQYISFSHFIRAGGYLGDEGLNRTAYYGMNQTTGSNQVSRAAIHYFTVNGIGTAGATFDAYGSGASFTYTVHLTSGGDPSPTPSPSPPPADPCYVLGGGVYCYPAGGTPYPLLTPAPVPTAAPGGGDDGGLIPGLIGGFIGLLASALIPDDLPGEVGKLAAQFGERAIFADIALVGGALAATFGGTAISHAQPDWCFTVPAMLGGREVCVDPASVTGPGAMVRSLVLGVLMVGVFLASLRRLEAFFGMGTVEVINSERGG